MNQQHRRPQAYTYVNTIDTELEEEKKEDPDAMEQVEEQSILTYIKSYRIVNGVMYLWDAFWNTISPRPDLTGQLNGNDFKNSFH